MSSIDAVRPAGSPMKAGAGVAGATGDEAAEATRRKFPMRPSYLVNWDETARRYADLVYSIPLRRGLSRHDVDDVFQNTWVVVLSKAEVPEEDGMAPWLAAIATYKTLAILERRRETPSEELSDELDDVDQPEPSQILERAENEQKVREALAKLPARDRLLLTELFSTEPPRNHAEIAADLGLSAGSVGTLRQRALDRLSKLVAA